jgi:transcriptional regulator with XRE-family HTH domain
VRSLDPDRICRAVGRRIAELRQQKGLTQEEFSVLLGTSFQWVSQIEGGRNMTLHSLVRIANALKTPLEELFEAPDSITRSARGRPRKKK